MLTRWRNVPKFVGNVTLRLLSTNGGSKPVGHNPATERKMTALELQHLARKGKAVDCMAMLGRYDHVYYVSQCRKEDSDGHGL